MFGPFKKIFFDSIERVKSQLNIDNDMLEQLIPIDILGTNFAPFLRFLHEVSGESTLRNIKYTIINNGYKELIPEEVEKFQKKLIGDTTVIPPKSIEDVLQQITKEDNKELEYIKPKKQNEKLVSSESKPKFKDVPDFLRQLSMSDYLDNFIKNGYDSLENMKGITIEKDLQDIGIVKSGHIKRIIKEILDEKLVSSESKPKFKDVPDFLSQLLMSDYLDNFINEGYDSLENMKGITTEKDLRDISIIKIGHIKRIIKEIKALNIK